MQPRALITGAAGQDGTYLTELLLAKGYEVWGVIGPEPGDYLSWAAEQGSSLHPIEADLTDSASLSWAIEESMPQEVYNLAGITSIPASWDAAVAVADVNATGVVRLLEALRVHAPKARFCQPSSTAIFGQPEDSPQDELTPIAPTSPYGASKAYAHFMTQIYRETHELHASNAILYNHESPRRPTTFVTRKITDGAARIKLGLAQELRLGDLDAQRDWGFAGDYVRAMWLMLRAQEPDDYVVATGVTHSVREFCDAAFSRVELDYRDYVVSDPAFMRPADATRVVGDVSKAREALGWQPEVGFEQLVAMMVDADMARLAAEG